MNETPTLAAQGTLELGLAGNGALRWAVADITDVMEELRGRFDLWPVPAAALGRCLSGAALLQRLAEKTPSRRVVRRQPVALARLGLRPAGETIAQAQDRLTTLSSAERQRVMRAARAAEERARAIREALVRKAAQESADKYTRD